MFIRDPNALAGDNGTSRLLQGNPELESGYVIFYDAEVEDLKWNPEFLEAGLGVGLRGGNEERTRSFDLLAYGYERDLRQSANLRGTHYGADLDLFALTPAEIPGLTGVVVLNDLSPNGDYKREFGVTLWVYFDEYTLFSQFVQQDIAGLDRKGWEFELSRRFPLPELVTWRDERLFSSIRPAVRYSVLNPNFAGATAPPGAVYPAPSTFWEWEKIDVGCVITVLPELKANRRIRISRDQDRAGTSRQ